MDADVRLARRLGRLLRMERERANLTQQKLARRLGTAQANVARFEAGRGEPSTATVERYFDALGLQLKVEVEGRDEDLDASIEAATAGTDLSGYPLDMMMDYLGRTLDGLGDVPYVFEGQLAAMIQGLPLVTGRIELVFAQHDLDAVATWVCDKWNWKRWIEKWREYGAVDVNPKRPGALRYRTPFCDVWLSLGAELPAALPIAVGERVVPVRPLADVEAADPQVARLASRWRVNRGVTPAARPS
jgi:transcriptional regulator with XRE-family HTH domain